jgi:hypothetical protein
MNKKDKIQGVINTLEMLGKRLHYTLSTWDRVQTERQITHKTIELGILTKK